MNEITAKLCVDLINKIEAGIALPRIKQNKVSEYKKAPKIFPNTNDVKIDWSKSVNDIERFVRALNPFFGAVSLYNEKPLKFWAVDKVFSVEAQNLEAGTVFDINKEEIMVVASDGFIKTKILAIDEQAYFSQTEEIIKYCSIEKGGKFE